MPDSIRIDTPESVDLALEPAGFGTRFAAAVIDAAIQGAVTFVIALVSLTTAGGLTSGVDSLPAFFGPLEGILLAVLLLILAFPLMLYKPVLELFWNGQTVGKRAMGIRVVRSNGLPVHLLGVIIRNFMRVVDMLPSAYVIGAIAVLTTRQHQRLGDIVAGTVVVRERQGQTPVAPPQPENLAPADVDGLRQYVLRLEEIDLEPLRGFWERRHQLEPEARLRVANLIAANLAARMSWTEPVPLNPEEFLEAVLHVRAL